MFILAHFFPHCNGVNFMVNTPLLLSHEKRLMDYDYFISKRIMINRSFH